MSAARNKGLGIFKWIALVYASNLAVILVLAARPESKGDIRGYLDIFAFVCLFSVALYALARVLFSYPFRLMDLLLMTVVLSLGMKVAVVAAALSHGIQENTSLDIIQPDFPAIVEICLLTSAILIAGAALGLRNCLLLKINSALSRALVLFAGMLTIPAASVVIIVPLVILVKALGERASASPVMELFALWVISATLTYINFKCALNTIVLKEQISAQKINRD